ncbi:MAG: MotA/TolQ/ExbB proton channel family protein [Bacteroidetes bacterium]|nr:MotA/TolQ/ExbB proton channel family protein [Bacteroidota bacterium]
MKQSVFMTVLMVVAFSISLVIYEYVFGAEGDPWGLEYIYKGGYLVVILMMLSIMVLTFVFERFFSLRKSAGLEPLPNFTRKVQKNIQEGDIAAAIEICTVQKGACANILRMGLEGFQKGGSRNLSLYHRISEARRAIEAATVLEVPLLEKNLIALSTIASIATMVGLLGTTIGMIRAFKALAQAGAPDAVQLSLGISEALINTAGGLFAAIVAIVAYNYFVNKVDTYTYFIEEATHNMLETMENKYEMEEEKIS